MFRAMVAALTLSLTAVPALAADNGFYLGVGVGQAGVQIDEATLGVGESFDGDDTAFKVIGGFRPLDWLAFEANYVDLGTADDDVLGVPVELDTSGIDVFVMGILPVGMIDLYLKGGVIFWDAKAEVGGFDAVDESDNDLAYGVGAGLHFGSVGARLEYERFDISDLDTVDMISLGVTWTFL